MSKGERQRKDLFQQCQDALAAARPKAARGFACPVCLLGWPEDFPGVCSKDGPLSLEHIPPDSVGSRLVILTCRKCNNSAGHELDHHIHGRMLADKVAAGERDVDVRWTFEGETVTARIRPKEGTLLMTADPKRSNPAAVKGLFDKMRIIAEKEVEQEYSFGLSFKDDFDPRIEKVAWLRVGYLLAFAVLGYNYILRPPLNVVREQIRKPDETLTTGLVYHTNEPVPTEGIHFVSKPVEYQSVVVVCGDRAIALPGFEQPSTFHDRMRDSEEWPSQMTAKQLPFFGKPKFILDHAPSLLHLMFPT